MDLREVRLHILLHLIIIYAYVGQLDVLLLDNSHTLSFFLFDLVLDGPLGSLALINILLECGQLVFQIVQVVRVTVNDGLLVLYLLLEQLVLLTVNEVLELARLPQRVRRLFVPLLLRPRCKVRIRHLHALLNERLVGRLRSVLQKSCLDLGVGLLILLCRLHLARLIRPNL